MVQSGCDWSKWNAYRPKTPDPTSGISWGPYLLESLFCILMGVMTFVTVRYFYLLIKVSCYVAVKIYVQQNIQV